MTGLEPLFLDAHSSREELEMSLTAECEKAKRMLRLDPQGRENQAWADTHGFMNALLDLLED